MPIYVERPASGALQRRLAELQAAARPGSRVQTQCRRDIRQIVVDDHTDMLLRGVDRYGKPRAKLAESTLKKKGRGPGPSLIPRGMASRFIANFEAAWVTASGVLQLVCRYRDIVSKQGRSFVQYHMTGCDPGSNPRRPNWSLPRRDTGGITPRGWAGVKARFARLKDDIRKGGGK